MLREGKMVRMFENGMEMIRIYPSFPGRRKVCTYTMAKMGDYGYS